MVKMNAQLFLSGPNFSPLTLEAKLKCRLTKKREKGDVGKLGRFKGKEYPEGSAVIVGMDEAQLMDFLEANISTLRESGASSINIQLNVECKGQCNFELGPEWLLRAGKIGLPIGFSCYRP